MQGVKAQPQEFLWSDHKSNLSVSNIDANTGAGPIIRSFMNNLLNLYNGIEMVILLLACMPVGVCIT